jgi:hypothetical protein
MTDKGVMVLQNYKNSENVLAGAYGETYPTCQDANQAMNIRAEEVIDTEEDPLPVNLQEIKAKSEVSFMSLYVHCKADITNM